MAEKRADDWKKERIKMTDLASFSGSRSYVRSLVRQQFLRADERPTAWERLRERFRERLIKNEEVFDYNEETPSFVRREEKTKYVTETEHNKRGVNTEDEERSSQEREGNTKTSWSPDLFDIARRQSVPQYTAVRADKQFTLGSTDVHSKILNRRLSLAENVIKNYRKYIRTPDETNAHETRGLQSVKRDGSVADENEVASRRGSKDPGIMVIRDEETFAPEDNSTLVYPLSSLYIPDDNTSGSSNSVPPSSVSGAEDSFRDVSESHLV